MIESRGNARAYNKSTGATGGFQFLEGTAKQYGVKDRYDLAQSAEGAGKYMSYLLKLFKGDLEKAVRAYHAGEGNVQKVRVLANTTTNIGKTFRVMLLVQMAMQQVTYLPKTLISYFKMPQNGRRSG